MTMQPFMKHHGVLGMVHSIEFKLLCCLRPFFHQAGPCIQVITKAPQQPPPPRTACSVLRAHVHKLDCQSWASQKEDEMSDCHRRWTVKSGHHRSEQPPSPSISTHCAQATLYKYSEGAVKLHNVIASSQQT